MADGKLNTKSFSKIIPTLLLSISVVAVSAPGFGASVQGVVTNGTTGASVPNQTVVLLMPQGGMQQVAEAKTGSNGHFVLSASGTSQGGFYLAQATYEGVDYNQPVRFDSAGQATANITVYQSSRSASSVRVPSARILIRAEGAKAHVQELFGVRNPSNPPRAYTDASGTFRFHIPPTAGQPTVAVTGLLNMPLPQTPQPGKRPGDFSISYPLKPGLTVVMVAYDQDYSRNQISLDASVGYPVGQTELFVFPPSLKVDSPIFKPEGTDQETNSRTYLAESLAANTIFAAQMSGPAALADSTADQSQGQIKIVPGSVNKAGVPLLLCFLLVLFWALGIRIAKEWPRWKAAQAGSPVRQKHQAKYEGVLRSIADLDELFAAGKLAERQYWKERLELKAKAVALLKKGPEPKTESYAARNTSR